jgi:hypothetical protein
MTRAPGGRTGSRCRLAGGDSGSRHESRGRSTNLVKLYRETSLSVYSAVRAFSERALEGLKKSLQTIRKKEALRIWRETTHSGRRQLRPHSRSLLFCITRF